MFKIQINKKTNNLFLFIFKFVFKIPLNIKSLKNINIEKKNFLRTQNSNFLKNLIPKNNFFFFILITEKGEDLNKIEERKFFKDYIHHCKSNFGIKETYINQKLEFINIKIFLKKFLPHFSIKFEEILINTKLIISPCHGDLHKKNVLKSRNNFFVIDLLTLSFESSYVFDLINFKLISSKYYNNNWYYLLSKYQNKFYKFLDKKYFLFFALWKIENEVKFLYIDENKIKKYKKIINDIFSRY